MNNAVAQQFDDQGTLLFDRDEIPLSEKEWQRLEALINTVEYEHVVGGDAGEGHSVRVCRFYNDIDQPVALNQWSDEISAIVMSSKMKKFYRRFTGTERLCLRRCQANLLYKGDFIGLHKDQDSSPDYFATIVFHLGSDYQGGNFITHDNFVDQHFHPMARTALVNNCSIPHEVSVVEHGERRTLACFLSKDFTQNINPRRPFRIAS